ncbi:MAG TPA: SDR family oxidoreductase [Gemmatimonadaceae bacterium]
MARDGSRAGARDPGPVVPGARRKDQTTTENSVARDERESRPLAGRVAVVTGASRGAGRGIALELGAAGAVVYVTGRSIRGASTPGYERMLGHLGLDTMPGTIEETAEEASRMGGTGIAVRCDHRRESDVRALFARVEREHGRLDLLVNNAWGAHQDHIGAEPFWEQPLSHWEGMFENGVRNHILSSVVAAPLLVRQRHGLIVTVTFWDRWRHTGGFWYDLAKAAMARLAFGIARDLRPHGVASVALSPGWMRTELVLAAHETTEARWREVPALARTESTRYIGRAVVALASDPNVMARSGQVLRVGDLATEYGFADVDGRWIPPFELPDGDAPARATGATVEEAGREGALRR